MESLTKFTAFLLFLVFIWNAPLERVTHQVLSPHSFFPNNQTPFRKEATQKWRQAIKDWTQHFRSLEEYENGGFIIKSPNKSLSAKMKRRINDFLLLLPEDEDYREFFYFIFFKYSKIKTPQDADNLFADKPKLTMKERITKKLVKLIWITDEGTERPNEERLKILGYISGTSKSFISYDKFSEILASALESVNERLLLYNLIQDYDWVFGEFFFERLFKQIQEETKRGDHPTPSVEIMLPLIQSGVPIAILPEVLYEFLTLSYPVYLKEHRAGDYIFMSAATPFQLLEAALEHNPKIATNHPLLKFIEKYRDLLRQYENKKEYAFTLEQALRAYQKLQKKIQRHSPSSLKNPPEINSSV